MAAISKIKKNDKDSKNLEPVLTKLDQTSFCMKLLQTLQSDNLRWRLLLKHESGNV